MNYIKHVYETPIQMDEISKSIEKTILKEYGVILKDSSLAFCCIDFYLADWFLNTIPYKKFYVGELCGVNDYETLYTTEGGGSQVHNYIRSVVDRMYTLYQIEKGVECFTERKRQEKEDFKMMRHFQKIKLMHSNGNKQ